MKGKTRVQLLADELGELEIGKSILKETFINKYWHTTDYFTRRSFDVLYNRTKKLMPEKTFCGKLNKEIKRLV